MAVSPLVSRSPSVTVSTNTAVRLRSVAAPNSPGGQESETPKSGQSPERELTEQLNDDIRNRYVKGANTPYLISACQTLNYCLWMVMANLISCR